MAANDTLSSRLGVAGKFFRLGAAKFYVKGVAYGPFAPDANNERFASREQTERDFKRIRELKANALRLYHVPPRWFLDLAAQYGFKVLIDIPWPKHVCFLDSERAQQEARETIRRTVTDCRGHPAVLAYSLANEIPAEIVRWSGVRRVEAFIDELVSVAKEADPDGLCTFTNFPPTEFLHPQSLDFVCFNVYLHECKSFQNYLARLQMLANTKPLVLSEFGMDSFRESEARKSEYLSWQIESAFQGGLAGCIVFSYTDDWWHGGRRVEDWAFGLTSRERKPKESFQVVQKMYGTAPYFALPAAHQALPGNSES